MLMFKLEIYTRSSPKILSIGILGFKTHQNQDNQTQLNHDHGNTITKQNKKNMFDGHDQFWLSLALGAMGHKHTHTKITLSMHIILMSTINTIMIRNESIDSKQQFWNWKGKRSGDRTFPKKTRMRRVASEIKKTHFKKHRFLFFRIWFLGDGIPLAEVWGNT